jgi:hypothetical protein
VIRVDLTMRRALINGAAWVVTLLDGLLFSIAAVAIESGKFSSTGTGIPLRANDQPRTAGRRFSGSSLVIDRRRLQSPA